MQTSTTLALTSLALILGLSFGMALSNPAVAFVFENAADDENRTHGLLNYFEEGTLQNECIFDVVFRESCERGILFENQKSMNEKLNWLLIEHGYNFED